MGGSPGKGAAGGELLGRNELGASEGQHGGRADGGQLGGEQQEVRLGRQRGRKGLRSIVRSSDFI